MVSSNYFKLLLCLGLLGGLDARWMKNVPDTPPPLILVDNDVRVERSSIQDELAEGLYQGDIMLTEEQRSELLSRKVTAGGGVDIDIKYADNALKARQNPTIILVTTETTVTSPNFPLPIQEDLKYVQVISAPSCYIIRLTFNAFSLYPPTHMGDYSFVCDIMSLEIQADHPISGMYCGHQIDSGTQLVTAGRTMELHFTSTKNSGNYAGYNATVQFVLSPDPNCVTSAPSTTPTTTSPTTTTPTTTTPTTTTPTTTTPTTTTPTTTTPTTTTPTTTTRTATTPTTTKRTTTRCNKTTRTRSTHTRTTRTTRTPTRTTRTRTTPSTTTSRKTMTKQINTRTTPPPGCTITNSGNVPLVASLTGSCHLTQVSATTFNLVSPNYPSRYSISDACKGWFSTIEPRYVRVTPMAVDIAEADLLSFKQVYQNTTRVTNALMGGQLVFPSSSAFMSFLADSQKSGNKFSFKMKVVNSKCHQIINIPLGVTCTLSIPEDYPPGTICEWWIKAPPGKKVSVTFSRFNVGNKECLEDYMDIDTTGDSQYSSATRYCGNNLQSPGTVTSKNNEINILMNGRDGHFGGFDATYTVV